MNWADVVEVMFDYVSMVKQNGPQKWIFEELQLLGQLQYGNLVYCC